MDLETGFFRRHELPELAQQGIIEALSTETGVDEQEAETQVLQIKTAVSKYYIEGGAISQHEHHLPVNPSEELILYGVTALLQLHAITPLGGPLDRIGNELLVAAEQKHRLAPLTNIFVKHKGFSRREWVGMFDLCAKFYRMIYGMEPVASLHLPKVRRARKALEKLFGENGNSLLPILQEGERFLGDSDDHYPEEREEE